MADETTIPIASGERTDQDVTSMVDERPTVPENANVTESLFGETVSEAELMGEEPPSPPANEAAQAQPQGEGKPAETPPPATEEPKTPPPGYVPLAALHEERGKRQAMSQRLQELESTVEALKSGKPAQDAPPKEEPLAPPVKTELPPDFKILTPQEFKDLAETDVVEAQIYQYNLNLYKEEQAAAKQATEGKQRAQQQVSQIIEQRYAEMEQAVPGIFEEDSAINRSLTEFAANNGLDSVYLGVLTDPGTRIVQADGRVQVLGKGAVQMLTMLNKLFQTVKPDPSKDAQLKAQGAAETLKKITDTTAGFRSVGSTPPGASSVPADPNRILSEAEMSRLSPEEQERYLSGG